MEKGVLGHSLADLCCCCTSSEFLGDERKGRMNSTHTSHEAAFLAAAAFPRAHVYETGPHAPFPPPLHPHPHPHPAASTARVMVV